jgi:hypothetical protein
VLPAISDAAQWLARIDQYVSKAYRRGPIAALAAAAS